MILPMIVVGIEGASAVRLRPNTIGASHERSDRN
jgi:hypothetical protein